MSQLVVAMYTTVDGVVEDPGGADDSPYGGWSGPYWSEELDQMQRELLFASDALLLGRKTFEGFAAAWPDMEHEEGDFADRMNSLPKHVATRTLKTLDWNATPVAGDLAEGVGELKRASGQELLIYGSPSLVDLLTRHRLIDRYRLMVHPVVVGGGQRMFEDAAVSLRLVRSAHTSTGVAVLDYVLADAQAGASR